MADGREQGHRLVGERFFVQERWGGDAEGRGSGVPLDWFVAHCLGFGMCWGWVHIAFFSTAFWGGGSETLGLNAWMLNVAANGGAMIVLGCLLLNHSPLHRHKVAVAFLVLLTLVGTLCLSAAHGGKDAFVYAGAVASGVGTAGLLLLWSEAYATIPPRFAKKYTIPVSMLMGVCFYLLVNVLPSPVAIAVCAALPVASALLMLWCNERLKGDSCDVRTEGEFGGGPLSAGGSIRKAVPLGFVAVTSIYCLAPGFMRGHTSALPFATSPGVGGEVFAGVAIVMIVAALGSIVVFRKSRIDAAYKLIVPLMAAGLLILPFLEGRYGALAAIAIMSGYILFEMFVWASLSDIAAAVRTPIATVFGFGKAGMNLGLLAGSFVGMWFGSSSTMLVVGVSVLIVYLFVVVGSITSPALGVSLPLPRRTGDDSEAGRAFKRVDIAEAAQMDLSDVFASLLDEKCEALAAQYELSNREREVLNLLARGRSLQASADVLGVAYSTVKTHTNHIYAKMGLHSRQELIKLIERE